MLGRRKTGLGSIPCPKTNQMCILRLLISSCPLTPFIVCYMRGLPKVICNLFSDFCQSVVSFKEEGYHLRRSPNNNGECSITE